MYAIVKCGGKQYKVEKDMLVKVEKIDAEVGAKVELEVLLVADDKGNVKAGADAAGARLDGVEGGEEGARGEVGADEGGGVEEAEVGELRGDVLRRGVVAAGDLEEGGAGEGGDGRERGVERGLAVAEVGAECDDGAHGWCERTEAASRPEVWKFGGLEAWYAPCGATGRPMERRTENGGAPAG